MIQAIVFDWDGVLEDSMSSIASGIQAVAASYGVTLSIENILEGYFQPKDAYYKSIGIDTSDMHELERRHDEAMTNYRTPMALFPEVANVLRSLHQQGFHLGIASNGDTEYILARLREHELSDIFAQADVSGGRKIKAEKLKDFLKKWGILPSELLFVGDLPSDIRAGREAGVQVAGIQRHELARTKLALSSPDYVFSSLTDLNNKKGEII